MRNPKADSQEGEVMTLNELMIQVKKYIDKGYGAKEILLDTDIDDYNEIDSIQQNTMPNVEPEYLLIISK